MRVVQYRILKDLLANVTIPDYIYGFERGKSIPKMAEVHSGKRVVISLDIKDFFPSIRHKRLVECFTGLGAQPQAADLLAEICTYKAFVPQGALTSPRISNIVTSMTFGPVLKKYCDDNELTLTIYADDVTISHAKADTPREYEDNIVKFVTETLNSFGFKVNHAKTKIMRPHRRQWVCGAVVNQKVNLLRKQRDILRALVHNSLTNSLTTEAEKAGLSVEAFASKYLGQLNWYAQLNPEKGTPLRNQFSELVKQTLGKDPEVVLNKLAYDSGVEDLEVEVISQGKNSETEMPF